MTAEEFRRKLTTIFSAAAIDRLKKAGVRCWKGTPTAFKAIASIVIALNAGWQLYSRLIPSHEVVKEKAAISSVVSSTQASREDKSPSSLVPPPEPAKAKVAISAAEKSSTIVTSSTEAFPKDKAKVAVSSREKATSPLLDKPSIAVLPFSNTGGDTKDERLSDGITDEIINSLGRSSQLYVIARNSTFTYKGKSVKVQQVSEEMGVRYVLEGNVQVSGEQVRIAAQLIDATQGNTLFSERYERELKNIFSIQDEITLRILGALHVKLTRGEEARVFAKETKSLEAYLKLMEARNLNSTFNRANLVLARQLAEESISLDRNYALAYSSLAMIIRNAVQMGAYKDPRAELEHGMEMAKKGVSLNDSLGYPHTVLGQYYCMMNRDFDNAVSEAERAMSLDPSSISVIQNSGVIFLYAGRYEDGLRAFITATRLSPIPNPNTQFNLASSYRWLGKYEEALLIYKRNLQTTPNHMQSQLALVATLMLMGKESVARAEAEKALAIDSNFSLDAYAKIYRQTYKNQEHTERFLIDPLRRAGLK